MVRYLNRLDKISKANLMKLSEKMGAKNLLVSLSDDYPLAQAVVIIEN